VDLYVLERAILSAHAADYAPVEPSEPDSGLLPTDDDGDGAAASAVAIELGASEDTSSSSAEGEAAAGAFFSQVLRAYSASSSSGPEVVSRFAAVRMRGRKRVAFG